MKSNNNSQNKFSKPVIIILLIVVGAILYYLYSLYRQNEIEISYKVPSDITNPADSMAAADFAWQEFIALTWPAQPDTSKGTSGYLRCLPDSSASYGSTGAGGVVVWETYYHRDELYPNYPDTNTHTLPPKDAMPNYLYDKSSITPATSTTRQNLFNNLDEASEISIANMYFTPLAIKADTIARNKGNEDSTTIRAAVKAAIMYEAKGNSVIYNYVTNNGFNNSKKRGPALKASINKIMNKSSDTTGRFNLPYGSIEIKASWRRYNSGIDSLNNFHWTVGMYYTQGDNNQLIVHNDTMLLVGLHIIQKTPNVPTFVFATFEHITNEKNGFRFVNAFPKTAKFTDSTIRALPDSGVIAASRQFAIPDYIKTKNKNYQSKIKNTVWANYQLIGVQAVVANNPNDTVSKQQFFLSNFATETNNTLQFFHGGLSGPAGNVPDPSLAHVFKYDTVKKIFNAYAAGGCLGCHGSQGQYVGGDFSVIAATGNEFIPQPVTPYPTLSNVVPQNPKNFPLDTGLKIKGKTNYILNTYKDVQELLDAFVANYNIPIDQSPHKRFWGNSYNSFTATTVYSLSVMKCGDSANSNIIKILKGPLNSKGYPQMPANSGQLPLISIFPRQDSIIARLSLWIQRGCPDTAKSQTVKLRPKK